ncbi:MAG: tape measure protein [Tetragenococcus halophilus]|nr:tape measure protein [Tetragenococcus halophilus]
MASDAQINIDVMLNNLPKFKSDVKLINDILADVGDQTGDKMDDSFSDSASKVSDEAKATEKVVDESLGKEVTTQLSADDTDVTNKTDNAKSNLEEIPEESETALNADSEDLSSKVGDAKSDIESMPEESETSLNADATDVSSKTGDAKSGLESIPDSTETEIKADAEDAKRDSGEVQSSFDRIPIRKTTRIEADAEDAKSDTGEVQSGYNQIPDKKQTRLDVEATQAQNETRRLGNEAKRTAGKFSTLREQLSIGAIAGAASAGFQMIVGSVGDLISETTRASDSILGFQSTMEFADFGNKEIQKTQKAMKDYADSTVYDLQTVANTTAQLGANGVDNFEKLMEATGNMNAVAGGTKDTFKSLSMMMTQTAGAGKLTTENWNQLADAIPGASGKMQKAMKDNGAYTGNFREAMEEGEISAEEFYEAIMQLGDTQKAAEYARGTSAYEGAIENLKSSIINGMLAIEDRIGKSKITDMINGMADGIVNLFDQFGIFFDYLDKHSDALAGIGKSLKDILGTLGSSIWKTSVDIIKSIAEMFGLVDEETEELNDPLEKIDSVLQNIADHKDGIKAVGKAIVGMFVIKKAMQFAGALRNVKNLLGEITAFGAAGGAGKAAGGGLLSKLATPAGITKLVPALGVAASIPELLKKGSKGAKGGGFLGGSGGAIGGAKLGSMIGTAIAPGIGTAIGSVLGGTAGQWAGSKLGRAMGDGVEEYWKENKPKPVTTTVKVEPEEIDREKIQEQIQPQLDELNEALLIKMGVDEESTEETKEKVKESLDQIYEEIDNYYNKKEERAAQNLEKLVEQGILTQEEADKRLERLKENGENEKEAQKENYGQIQEALDAHNERLAEIRNNDSLSREEKNEQMQEANKEFAQKYVETNFNAQQNIKDDAARGAKEQKEIYNGLVAKKGELSLQELEATRQSAKKQYNSATQSARDTRDEVKDAAQQKYENTKSIAWKEYKEHGTITWEEYQDTIQNARSQRDETKEAADDQYAGVTKKARDQYNKVTKEIGKQKDGVVKTTNAQKNAHINTSQEETDETNAIYRNGFMDFRGVFNSIINGVNGILGFFNEKWKDKIPTIPAHAKGSSGLSHDETALVGEEGFELAHHPSKGIYPIGSKGPEVRPLEAGTSILPHNKSKEFLAMTKGLPAHKSGVWGKVTDAYDWVKGKIKDGADWVTESAGTVYDKLYEKVGAKDLLDSFSNAPILSKSSKGMAGTLKDSIVEYAQQFFDQFGGGSFDGKKNANGVYQYLVDIAKKTMKKFPGMRISSGLRKGDPNDHGRGQAIDLAYGAGDNGNSKYFDPANWVFDTFKKQIAYVITQGKVRDRKGSSGQKANSKWGNWPPNDHYDHLHLSGMWGPGDVRAGGNIGKVGGNWKAAVKKALKSNGLPTTGNYVNAWLRQIQSESGGNPKAIGGTDGLADGRATGLLQTKPGTFNAFAHAGHKNIMNGYDNILAAMAYAKARYPNMLSVIGHGNGYANGGEVYGKTLAWLGEDPNASHEYIINPKKDSADALISKAIAAREQVKPAASTNISRHVATGSQNKTGPDTPRKIQLEVPVYLSKNAPRELGYATAEYVEEKNSKKATVKKLLEGKR